jgi:hypothetical protein
MVEAKFHRCIFQDVKTIPSKAERYDKDSGNSAQGGVPG